MLVVYHADTVWWCKDEYWKEFSTMVKENIYNPSLLITTCWEGESLSFEGDNIWRTNIFVPRQKGNKETSNIRYQILI